MKSSGIVVLHEFFKWLWIYFFLFPIYSPDSWGMSLSCWRCWLLSWPFKNVEGALVVCSKSVRGCWAHPSAGVHGRQAAELPSLKGIGEGWWRTRMAGGHYGSAPPCSSSYSGDSSKHQGRKGSAHLCRSTNISCASWGIHAWQWAQLTQGGGSCAAALHCFSRSGVMITEGKYSLEFLFCFF